MIKTVIRCPDNTVMAFDENGNILPLYLGHYMQIKKTIMEDTSSDTVFSHYFDDRSELIFTPREAW
jgi:hypothetical protein